jgi:hypothetical protein
MATDYYLKLGVSPAADQKKIQKAYRSIVNKFHPDVTGTQESSERFLEIRAFHRLNCLTCLLRLNIYKDSGDYLVLFLAPAGVTKWIWRET